MAAFQAGTTLDVRLHPTGMCNSGVRAAGERIDAAQMSSDDVRKYGKGLKLVRDVFPRPFSIAADGVAIRDITMQNVEGAKSDFVHYQGVWRLQPLDGCAAPGENMMRLTFAVECEPHWFLPVAPVEGRIAEALVENMEAIRAHVEATVQSRAQAAAAAGVASPASAAAPVQAAAPAKEKTLWDQAAEWVAENAPQAPAGAPQWVPFSLDGLPRRALRRRGAPLAGARLRFGAGASPSSSSSSGGPKPSEAMTGALARTEATLGALEPLGAGLEAGAGAAGLVDVLAAAVAVEGLAPQVLMGAAVAAIAAWSGSTRQSGNQGVAEAGWAGGDDDLKRAWLAVLEQHPEAVVQKEFLGVPFERDMLKRRLNRFARLLGISVAQAVPIIEVDATPLLVESADISEVLGRLATITSVEKARELVSKNPTLVAGRAADRKKEDGLAVSAIVDILYAGRLQKVLEDSDGGKDTRGKIAEIELYLGRLASLKPLADVAFRGLTAGNAAAATRRLFRALQQVVPNESIRVLLGRVAEAERPWEYLVEQTTAGLSMARGLVQRPSMTTPIVNYWTPIMMHLPSIYTRLSILRPHVPAIVRILDPYFEIVEPYLDRIMERMDRTPDGEDRTCPTSCCTWTCSPSTAGLCSTTSTRSSPTPRTSTRSAGGRASRSASPPRRSRSSSA
ncbi:unnamed protein product [Prorocentrum cordatum]|uniref:Coenzyme Q-binding protein COQ10 START domain-containing protein n=1 Tax=Prorocentrum cordatum TaxID=2364126 RepID=A0ABN9UJD4_9DINO|nr:unnamed protein product [Polarella glacialis]